LAAALKELGFDHIFDTQFSADLTIMEEGFELLDRIKNNGVLPMYTSCCPGIYNYNKQRLGKYGGNNVSGINTPSFILQITTRDVECRNKNILGK
jgi:iron only hydrogenase large subunit-like protein